MNKIEGSEERLQSKSCNLNKWQITKRLVLFSDILIYVEFVQSDHAKAEAEAEKIAFRR